MRHWAKRLTFLAALSGLFLATPLMAQYSDGYNFLKAVRDRDVQKARGLIDKPGSIIINARDVGSGDTGLAITLKRKDVPWTALMLQSGADPNMKDGKGEPPIVIAATNMFPDGVRLLLIKNARVDETNGQGETALIKAVHMQDYETAKILLDAHADPDRPDNLTGMSAREYAARDLRGGPLAKLLAEAPKAGKTAVVGPR